MGVAIASGFLGLEGDHEINRLIVRPVLCNRGGVLFGGAQASLALATIARMSGAPVRSLSIHFLASARSGDICKCSAMPLVRGRNLSQWAASGTVGGAEIFRAQAVTAPLDHTLLATSFPLGGRPFKATIDPSAEPSCVADALEWKADSVGHLCETGNGARGMMWVRLANYRAREAADAAFFADWVPSAINLSAPRFCRGMTAMMDFHHTGNAAVSDWLRQEIEINFVQPEYAVGQLKLFDESNNLIAVSSQAFKPFA